MSKIVLLEGNTDYFKAEVSFGEIGLVLSSYDKKHSLEGSNIGLSKHQALQLAAAITEHYSEWIKVEEVPTIDTLYNVKVSDGSIICNCEYYFFWKSFYYNNHAIDHITHYQPKP